MLHLRRVVIQVILLTVLSPRAAVPRVPAGFFGVSTAITAIAQRRSCRRGITSCVVSLARTIFHSASSSLGDLAAAPTLPIRLRGSRRDVRAAPHPPRDLHGSPYPRRKTPVQMPNMLETAMEDAAAPVDVMAAFATRRTTPSTATRTMTA